MAKALRTTISLECFKEFTTNWLRSGALRHEILPNEQTKGWKKSPSLMLWPDACLLGFDGGKSPSATGGPSEPSTMLPPPPDG